MFEQVGKEAGLGSLTVAPACVAVRSEKFGGRTGWTNDYRQKSRRKVFQGTYIVLQPWKHI
jgi:hypothetical protein